VKARRVPNAVGFGLARNRRSPKRPSEPRSSGVYQEEAQWGKEAEPPRSWGDVRCILIFISANALGGLRHGGDSNFQHSESLAEVVERKRLVNKHFAHCLVVFSQQLVQRLVRHKFHRCWKSGIVIRPS
jgi:hypothetical protein